MTPNAVRMLNISTFLFFIAPLPQKNQIAVQKKKTSIV